MLPVLPAFYFGSVEHYLLLARHAKVIIDVGEHYERQSYRTRTSIVGPNGIQHLNVRITRDHGHKMPMRTVGLTYAENWPQQHLHAMRSAYGQTPWFIHYFDDIEATLLHGYSHLVELDLATMRLGMKWLGLRTEVIVRETYVEPHDEIPVPMGPMNMEHSSVAGNHHEILDLRHAFHPKKALPVGIPILPSYQQAFADRHGFIGRMSVIDLMCNLGPMAATHLAQGQGAG